MNTLAGILAGLRLLTGIGQTEQARSAWALLESGRIEEAYALAGAAVAEDESPEILHVLFNTEYLFGRYDGALAYHGRIPAGYARRRSLDEPTVNAYRHLGRYSEALAFAKGRNRSAGEMYVLEKLAATPFAAHLANVCAVPFADHPLTPYFPAFNASINGQAVTAHIDTGGNYLLMGRARAVSLGIGVRDAGTGQHGANHVPMSFGIAKSFHIGDAVLSNVQVTVMDSLEGDQDFVIFGTNIIQPFLSTLDYSNSRMILSPRGNPELTRGHLAMLPGSRTEVPFYMWSDHYMLAQGRVGDVDGYFFIDSGLVMILPWQGAEKQAALLANRSQYRSLRLDDGRLKSNPIALPTLSLGGLTQEGHIGVLNDACPKELGGVAIHGLLSHAYLSGYAWTIDFDRRIFTFTSAPASGPLQ